MRLLVTGGCGFIFSHFIRHILQKYPDYKIINLDKLTYCGNIENTKDFRNNRNYKFIKGDICDKKLVERTVKEVDVIINGAAETHVDRSIIDAGSFVKTDIFGTYVLLEAARKNDVEKYIQISTDEAYGSVERGSFKEGDPLNPNSPYSASKAGADLLVGAYRRTHGTPAVITRSSNNYGSYQFPEKLIPLFITNLLRGKKVPLYGDGSNVRDWLFVTDNCAAVDTVLHKGKIGETYNIASSDERTNLEITKMLLKLLGKPDGMIQHVQDRKGHDFRYSMDCSKMRAIGWKPRVKLEEGLEMTIEWYKNNEWWWRPIVKKLGN
ncbi:MAG: dTDP-glucose 4,6-dehydratase [Candidatus Fermentimicrarchaeum limneticum]|uniref:dTDP-glucose 4,6-dehydratase n=1 Tax=Fermentimicrarchaeum limneticum TaxID=2795018 RepID=A0A7D5XMA5_FERL1|nr:MAG: dTDP-glucose 4,6-dehydratase [Candidatus Fermentimicrarchaeum limneticum]